MKAALPVKSSEVGGSCYMKLLLALRRSHEAASAVGQRRGVATRRTAGWGSSNCWEGVGATPALTNTTGAVRKLNG